MPAFEIGICNAWIFMLAFFLFLFLPFLVLKVTNKKEHMDNPSNDLSGEKSFVPNHDV